MMRLSVVVFVGLFLSLATACGSNSAPSPSDDVGVDDSESADTNDGDGTETIDDAGTDDDAGTIGDAARDDTEQRDAVEDSTIEDVSEDGSPDVDEDAGSLDAADDSGQDAADVVSDAATDVETDVAADVVSDAATDVVSDAATDVETDVAVDVVSDAATDVVSDATDPDGGGLFCDFGGTGSQDFGDDCGCVDDCDEDAPRCTRNLLVDVAGPNYCTFTCADDGECGDGYQCNAGIDGVVEPFCEECASPIPDALGLGDSCICDADCGVEGLPDGRDADLTCVGGVCTISPCRNFGATRCPDGWQCETPLGGDARCVECLYEVPAGEDAECACESDCGDGLTCTAGVCRRTCDDDGDCSESQECREQVSGADLCTEVPDACDPARDGGMGAICRCNAECGDDAPVCLTLEFGGVPASVCTQRPCSVSDADPCPTDGPGTFRCCGIPFVIENTCVSDGIASAIDTFAICSP